MSKVTPAQRRARAERELREAREREEAGTTPLRERAANALSVERGRWEERDIAAARRLGAAVFGVVPFSTEDPAWPTPETPAFPLDALGEGYRIVFQGERTPMHQKYGRAAFSLELECPRLCGDFMQLGAFDTLWGLGKLLEVADEQAPECPTCSFTSPDDEGSQG